MSRENPARSALKDKIIAIITDVHNDQTPDQPLAEFADDMVLLESGLDSLGFAIVVTRLEEDLGYDPFSLAEEAYYPTTLGEFVDFYLRNMPP